MESGIGSKHSIAPAQDHSDHASHSVLSMTCLMMPLSSRLTFLWSFSRPGQPIVLGILFSRRLNLLLCSYCLDLSPLECLAKGTFARLIGQCVNNKGIAERTSRSAFKISKDVLF